MNHKAHLHTCKRKDGFFVSTDQDRLDIEKIHQWLSIEAHWSLEIPVDLIERAIKNSLCFGVYTPEKLQVGFGRIVTDYSTFGWVTDIFIDTDYRGRGLARYLMECMRTHPDLQILRRWLLGTSHAAGLYKKLGYSELENPDTYFTIHVDEMYQRGLHTGKY